MPLNIKEVELLNLSRNFNHSSVTSSIPEEIPNFETPPVMYTLKKSIQSGISAFNKFVSSLDF